MTEHDASPNAPTYPYEGPLDIGEDITRAKTLSSEIYRDPAWYEAARERVFASSW